MVSDDHDIDPDFVGPLLDDGAPYSGMGLADFQVLQPLLLSDWNGELLSLPKHLQSRPYWQCGNGEHSSETRKILGLVLLSSRTDNGDTVTICHLIIEGSSQWIIGRNVTRKCNVERIATNTLILPDKEDSISLVDYDLHVDVS